MYVEHMKLLHGRGTQQAFHTRTDNHCFCSHRGWQLRYLIHNEGLFVSVRTIT